MPTLKTKVTQKKVKSPAKKAVKKTAKKAVKKVTKKAVKKTVKKAVKKSSKKKVVKRFTTKNTLVLAEDTKSFWVNNGQILNSLVALRDALDEMEKEVYQYHAGDAQNDFSEWVASVLSDTLCAKDLQKAKTPKSAKTVVVRHLKRYSI